MAEVYKLMSQFRADIRHERTGELIDYSARIFEGPAKGRFYIENSHVLRGTETAGFYYGDSFTSADSVVSAENGVMTWIAMLEKAYEVKPWRD
jgi:hypothetical protein